MDSLLMFLQAAPAVHWLVPFVAVLTKPEIRRRCKIFAYGQIIHLNVNVKHICVNPRVRYLIFFSVQIRYDWPNSNRTSPCGRNCREAQEVQIMTSLHDCRLWISSSSLGLQWTFESIYSKMWRYKSMDRLLDSGRWQRDRIDDN
jgi:hypothetical protein